MARLSFKQHLQSIGGIGFVAFVQLCALQLLLLGVWGFRTASRSLWNSLTALAQSSVQGRLQIAELNGPL